MVVEVGRGEEHCRVLGQQGLLRHEVLHAGAQDGPVGHAGAESLDFPPAKRSLPHEQLVLHPPLAQLAREPLAGLGQLQCDAAHVLPGGHAQTVLARVPAR